MLLTSLWRRLISVGLGCSTTVLSALCAFSPSSWAQQPVKDINTQPLSLTVKLGPSAVRSFLKTEAPLTRLGAWTYFAGSTLATGSELFRTNGTKTELVKDINPGVDGSSPAEMALIRGKLYFQAFEPEHGAELWVSDGTPKGTRLFTDFLPGTVSAWPLRPTGMNQGRILCLLRAKKAGLWITDGTPAGTKVVVPGLHPNLVSGWQAVSDGSLTYFSLLAGSSGENTAVWVTDGTSTGTKLLMKGRIHWRGLPLRPVGKGGMLFETLGSQHVHEVWACMDGRTPVHLMTLSSYTDDYRQGIGWSREYKGRAWFLGLSKGVHSLFLTDGTKQGTLALLSKPGHPLLTSLTDDGQQLWFVYADHHKPECEIWVSDGTRSGTKIWGRAPVRSANGLCPTGGRVYFRGVTLTAGAELWVSDGTKTGTYLVHDIVKGKKGSYPWHITEVAKGTVAFIANDGLGQYDSEVWVSQGTAKSTKILDFKAWSTTLDTADDKVQAIVGLHGRVLFTADDGKTGIELWSSDGTAKGTALVKDILPGSKGGVLPITPCVVGNRILFAANDGSSGMEPWTSDGTRQGTRLLKDLVPGSGASWPGQFLSVKGRAHFMVGSGASGASLWVSDGSPAGTLRVKGISGSLLEARMAIFPDGRLLLSAWDYSRRQTSLWVTDRTGRSGQKVLTLPALYSNGWGPKPMISFEGKVYFAADDGKSGVELWSCDGTNQGTKLFANLASDTQGKTSSHPGRFFTQGGRLFFEATTPAKGLGLWVSDGTVAGTRFHSQPGALREALSYTPVGSRYVYFSAFDSNGRRNLAHRDLQGKIGFFSKINPVGHSWPGNQPWLDHAFAVEDGAVWFSAKKYGRDRQLYALSEHAIAHPIGAAMATTTLGSTDPIQGQSAQVEAGTAIPQPLLLVVLGLPAQKPLAIPPIYHLYYDFFSATLPVGAGLGNKLKIGLPIPASLSFRGAKVVLQAFAMDPQRFPSSLELSNAIHWRLGR